MAIGENLTKREQGSLSIAILALLVLGLFWYFRYEPKKLELVEIESRIESLEAGNRRAKVELTQGSAQEIMAEAEIHEANLSAVRELIPDSHELASLLEGISNAARRAGLDLASVEPLPILQGEHFDTYRYKIGVLGDYHSIGKLLSNIGSMNRIVAASGLELSVNVAQGGNTTSLENTSALIAKFQIQTFVVKEDNPVHKVQLIAGATRGRATTSSTMELR